jgi:hypothetical protein
MSTADEKHEGERFMVLSAMRDGLPALIAVNTALNKECSKGFPWLITITLPMAEVAPNGLCSDAESSRLDWVEDRLLRDTEKLEQRYLGRVTWNGAREVLIYVRDPEAYTGALRQQIDSDLGFAGIQIAQEHDANWSLLHQFCSTSGE